MLCGGDSGEPVSLPEWSKGLRSGRNVFERVGSNPTADNPLLSLTTKCCNAYSRAVISAFYLLSFSCSQAQTRRLRSTKQAAHHVLGTLAITVAVCRLHHCRICQTLDS